MSEFIAEARIRVRPDTTRFRAELQEEVRRAISQTVVPPLQIPVVLGQAGTGIAAVATATGALTAAQQAATQSTLGLASAAQVENSAFGRQATILNAATTATIEKAGADAAAARTAAAHARAQNAVGTAALASTAGMLGLRGAVLTASGAFIAATVGFQALGKAVQSSIQFERELNVFAVTAGATADQMERVAEVSRELGRDITLPGVAANDAAESLSLLARAGLSVEDSLAAVRGTLQLATAAQIENAAAAELVANSLNAFKLDGAEATRVADLLAGAANESQGSINDMGLALKQTAAIASGLGISLEDTVTILTQLSRAGLSASDAGTSFRQTLLRLIQDLPKVNEEVERLGLNLRDAQGNIRPEVFEELGRKLQRLSPAARQLAIANLGGADAIRTLLILTRAAAGEFDAVQDSISRAGAAQELAAAQTQGLGGDIEATKNELAEFGLTLGNVASGPLGLIVRTAGQAAGAINDLNQEVSESTGGQGFFSAFNDVVSDLAGSFARLNIQFQQGVRNANQTETSISALDGVIRGATDAVDELNAALQKAAANTTRLQGDPGDQGLNVQQVLNRVAGFDDQQVRAEIRSDNEALIAALQAEQAFLEQQLQRQFVQNRPKLRRQLEAALLGVTNELASISDSAASARKKAIADAERAQREADQALLALFSQRRQGIANAIAAADTAGEEIGLQNKLQAEIKREIAAIRRTINDENERRNAILDLRAALIQSQQAEEDLREQRKEERLEQRARLLELNVQIATATGNEAALERALLRQIAFFKKQRDLTAAGSVARKEWILKIVEARRQLEELEEEAKKMGTSFQQASFEFLQAQQGFAANLFGNLIPGGATGGLVGNTAPPPSATAQVGAAMPHLDMLIGQTAAKTQAEQQQGFTAGQGNATNTLLLKILQELKQLNRGDEAPEANRQRKRAAASMDGAGTPSMDWIPT